MKLIGILVAALIGATAVVAYQEEAPPKKVNAATVNIKVKLGQ